MSGVMRTGAAMIALACLAAPSLAADDLAKDLSATIALLGLPCGQVVSARKLKDNDCIAICQDKNRYRVFVNAEGRVVAQKQ
jgi:BarA-like signal transduction histidine kinase